MFISCCEKGFKINHQPLLLSVQAITVETEDYRDIKLNVMQVAECSIKIYILNLVLRCNFRQTCMLQTVTLPTRDYFTTSVTKVVLNGAIYTVKRTLLFRSLGAHYLQMKRHWKYWPSDMIIKIFASADNARISLDEFNWLSSLENWVGAFSFFGSEIFVMIVSANFSNTDL